MTANPFEFAPLTGHSFSIAERAAIQASSAVLLTQTRMSRVKVWGKVLGLKADYVLVQCIGAAALDAPLTFFSTDGALTWSLVESIAPEREALCKTLQGTYMGDAAYEYRVAVAGSDKVVPVKESERLAYFIATHDFHCRVIPRGSQLQHEDGSIRLNACFEGLDRAAAGRLGSYLHVRKERRQLSALEKEGVSTRVDFLDSLAEDMPRGIWDLKYDPVRDCVVGQSNLIVGAVFYHVPETNLFGNIYIGDGNANQDFAFML